MCKKDHVVQKNVENTTSKIVKVINGFKNTQTKPKTEPA